MHSWSDNQKTDGVLLRLNELNSVQVDVESKTVSVGAGCQVKRLLQHLKSHGLTIPSLGLIDEQTVAGATATGTHGSGKHCLSHYIESVSIAHYDAETREPKVTVVETGSDLNAARCSLGLLGIIVEIKFRCRERYNIEEHALAHATLESALAMEAEYPQQQFYLLPWSWRFLGHHRVESNAPRSKLATLYRWYCFLIVDIGLHVAIFVLAKLLRLLWPVKIFYKWLLPLTIVRKWKVVDDSHAMLVMEHELFRHIEIEVFVQRSDLQQATDLLVDLISFMGDRKHKLSEAIESQLRQIDRWEELQSLCGDYIHHYPICYRRILPDNSLISMTSRGTKPAEDWYSISLISYQWPSDRAGFLKFAKFVATVYAELFDGRCHWGKFNPLDAETVERLYPQLGEFREVMQRFDTDGVFKNDWFRKIL